MTLNERARTWHRLPEVDLARLRLVYMTSLSRWSLEPSLWWEEEHTQLLLLKRACGLRREEESMR